MVDWLERAGHDEIYILDNDSAYEPLLDWYKTIAHRVIYLGRNVGKNALWEAPGVFELTRGRPFAYSDSDVVPDSSCPPDAADRFLELLGRYKGINKAGFGIRFGDIPDHYAHKALAVEVERFQCAWPLEPSVYYAIIDTQFAVYRPGAQARPHAAARTGRPYVARHHSYYLDLDALSEEDGFYALRSEEARTSLGHFSHWASGEILKPRERPLPGC